MSKNPYVRLSVKLSKPVTGQKLSDALQSLTKSFRKMEFIQKLHGYIDGVTFTRICLTSEYPGEDIEINAQQDVLGVNLSAEYSEFWVASAEGFNHEIYSTFPSLGATITRAHSIRDALLAALGEK